MLCALSWYAIATISGALPALSALPIRPRPCPCSWTLPLQIPLEVLPYAYPPTFVTKQSGRRQIPSIPWLKDLNLIRISITHFSLEEINTDFPPPTDLLRKKQGTVYFESANCTFPTKICSRLPTAFVAMDCSYIGNILKNKKNYMQSSS